MRKISRRNFLLASGAVAVTAALSACGGSSSSTAGSTASSTAASSAAASESAAAEGKVLNIWCWNDEFQGRFNDYYPEVSEVAADKSTTTLKDGTVVKWTINANENNNYQNKLDEALLNQDSAADDDKIDIFLIEADYALKYVDSDYVLDVKKDIGLTDSDLAGQYQYPRTSLPSMAASAAPLGRQRRACSHTAAASPRMFWAPMIPPKCRPTCPTGISSTMWPHRLLPRATRCSPVLTMLTVRSPTTWQLPGWTAPPSR